MRIAETSFKSMHRREKQLSFAQQLAKIGSWEWDPEADVVVASPELQERFNAPDGAITMDAWLEPVHPEDVESVRAMLDAAVKDGAPMDIRYRLQLTEGTLAYLHVRAERLGGGESEPLRIVGVSQDVTDQMLAENALRESEARYRILVEQAKDAIVSIDLEGRVTALNRAAEELAGGSRVEWIGRPIVDALTPESAQVALEQLAAVLGGADPDDYREYEVCRPDGRTATVEAQVRAVRAGGRVAGIVLVARDVTARKEAEARAEQEKRLASLGQLATSVAHEFNNVLMSIMPFAELMQRRLPDNPHVATATRHITDAVRRGREISQEILRFARPANPELAPLLISEWADAFRLKAEAILGPSFEVSVAIGDPEAAAAADRALLDQVATNITLNARDAMPRGGTFEIGVRAEEGRVLVDFTDSGCGIPPELLDRIFEPLYTTKHGGNGLGLPIAHQAAVQQNGSIRVHSVAGEGSTFTLSLPEVPSLPSSSAAVPPSLRRRVLIVEDDESVGEGLRILLADEGFDVELIGRGLEAVPAIEAFQPDLVLLDVNLPDVSGIEVYDRIRIRHDSLPVIFSTGHADARALAEVRDRKVPSIMKPYEIEELISLMSTVSR
ncbi:MAG TPA: PAS domain S-box protein [Thermoanaerobaculia bacterium]|nr:PAS domain S-box protein [Thermoanaerobaculia bacterium]